MDNKTDCLYTFLSDIQRGLYGKCHSVLSMFGNGDISFGVYSDSPRLWMFSPGDSDSMIEAKMDNIRGYLGIKC